MNVNARRTSLALLLFLGLTLPAVVQAQFTYTTNNGTVTITGYDCFVGAVTIPETIYGLPVTSIGDSAFAQCSGLTNVTIPASVTSIGAGAFAESGLTSVTIPDSVISIGAFAFQGSGLTNVTIGNSVTSIGDSAFNACSGLTAITVDPTSPAYSSADGVLFDKSQTMLIQYPIAKAGINYSIPNTVASIGVYAFLRSGLTSVTIPDSVTSIGAGAFEVSHLTTVTIGNSVTSIGEDAFHFSDLQSVTIPDSVTSIGALAFADSSLGSVTIGNSVTSIGDWAFLNSEGLRSAYFRGNAPRLVGSGVFASTAVIVYYLPGTSGWGAKFDFPSTALWVLPSPMILSTGSSFGRNRDGFGFLISWATNNSVVVEASPSLTNSTWSAVATNTLADGSSYFTDPQWKKYPNRFYRLRSL